MWLLITWLNPYFIFLHNLWHLKDNIILIVSESFGISKSLPIVAHINHGLTKYLHCSSKNCLCIGSHWEKKKNLTFGSNKPYLGMILHDMANKYNFNINVHLINK